ncbi:MAG: hypothetical protein Q4C12_07110 [Clostridia bacterium]|nr:hypothetical protein [Clostridia bacterium]
MTKRQKMLWFYSACVLTFALSMAAGFFYQIGNSEGEASAPTNTTQEAKAVEATIITKEAELWYYEVNEEDGFIALYEVYDDATKRLVEKTDTPTASLREGDRKLIREGIALPTLEEAQTRIEDFVS